MSLVLFTGDGLAGAVAAAALTHGGYPFRHLARWPELDRALAGARAAVFLCPGGCPALYVHCSALCRREGVPFAVGTDDRDPAGRALAALRGAVVMADACSPHSLLKAVRELMAAGRRPPLPAALAAGMVRVSPEAVVDLDRREVYYRGLRLPLTAGEYRLLALLLAEPGRPVAAAAVAAGGDGVPGGRERLYALVQGLRSKLGDRERRLVRNARGRGYRLELAPGLAPPVPPPAEVCGRPGEARGGG